MAILVDINGTIAYEGKPIQSTIDYLQTITEDIYVISGSATAKRKDYESMLKGFGVSYVDIILNDISETTDLEFKLNAAKAIPDLTLAIDNNKNVIRVYREAGINAIFPQDLIS